MADVTAQNELFDAGPAAPAEVTAAPETVVADAATAAPETPAAEDVADTGAETSLLGAIETPGIEKPADAAETEAEAEAATTTEEKPAADSAVTEEKPTDKPADASAETEAAAPETAAPETPVLEPVEYKYELPETLKMDDATKTATHTALDAFRADPTNPQPLIDLHHEMMQKHAAAVQRQQWDVFNETKKQWRQEVLSDNEIGGSGHNTAMQAIARMRDRFASSARPGTKEYDADLQAFNGMLEATGVGNHPIFLKMMHRIGGVYDEAPMGPGNVTPAPQKKSGMKSIYNHPTSPGVKQ
jgi:hypothetical protein